MIIKLQGNFETVIDDEDFDLIKGYAWYAVKGRTTYYVQAPSNYGLTVVKMHRVLMGLDIGDFLQVDHKNADGLDNRRSTNLRICTGQENTCNSKLRCDNKSGYKGVYKKRGRYQAQIRFDGYLMNLGMFDDPAIASLAYKAKAKELHGEFYCER